MLVTIFNLEIRRSRRFWVFIDKIVARTRRRIVEKLDRVAGGAARA